MLSRITPKLLKLLQLQLYITLISLPCLYYWGFGISLITIISNIFFAPWLTCFLLLCSLLFFVHIIGIPGAWLSMLINYFCALWQFLLSYAQTWWVIPLSEPFPGFLSVIAIVATLIIAHTRWGQPKRCSILLMLLLSGSLLAMHGFYRVRYYHSNLREDLAPHLTLYSDHYCHILVDYGALAPHAALCDLEFKSIPALYKKGITHIDAYIITKPSITSLKVASRLIKLCAVKTLYLPLWNGESSPALLKAYGVFRHQLTRSNTQLRRLAPKADIALTKTITICVSPSHNCSSQTIQYPTVTIEQHERPKERASLSCTVQHGVDQKD